MRSCRPWDHYIRRVLILVLMEDTLRDGRETYNQSYKVLILVLMEDTLRVQSNYGKEKYYRS